MRPEGHRHAEEEGGVGAERHERVHARRCGGADRAGTGVELGAHPELHRRGQEPQDAGVAEPAGAQGKSSGMLPISTGTAGAHPPRASRAAARSPAPASARSRSRLSGRDRDRPGIVYPAAATAACELASAAGSRSNSTRRPLGGEVDRGVGHARDGPRARARPCRRRPRSACPSPGDRGEGRRTLRAHGPPIARRTGRRRRAARRASAGGPASAGAHRVRHARLEMLAEQELLHLSTPPGPR